MDDATSVNDVMAVYKFLCSSQWVSKVWKQNFFLLGSVSAVREVKHKHHDHLILDSAKTVNNYVFAWGFLLLFVVIWYVFLLICCSVGDGLRVLFLIVVFLKNSNH